MTLKRLIAATFAAAVLLNLCSCSMFYTNTVKTISQQSIEGELNKKPDSSVPSSNVFTGNSFLKNVSKAADKNHDTVGWLYIPSTDIDNSVLQSFDNSYYIRRDEQRNNSVYGCYFVDCDCPVGTAQELARNTIIYGHSDLKDSADGKRFSQLFKFADEAFAKATPNVYFSTAQQDLVWRVFAAFYTKTTFNYIQNNPSDTQFERMIQKAREGSLYNYDVDVTGSDKILTLSTCSVKYGSDGTGRFVVMARLLRDGEKPYEAPKSPVKNSGARQVE
ncbi:class B sortase [Acetanaerobacterium elongatum]|uniref:Sortase B n=1 Tax=Acetanaerobacterium elongatum TaxID=258515 RepID=A0A1G9VL57_9FIRM|nr:class B sortase [Acetanaerobacterium elongatum]SDM72972.1 sortase B [Acetanaerobacterium elongatum]